MLRSTHQTPHRRQPVCHKVHSARASRQGHWLDLRWAAIAIRYDSSIENQIPTDLTVTNRIRSDKRETLDFNVVSNGECTVNTTHGEQVHAMGRIFGGDFGSVEPGKSETVSLVWPTVVGPMIIDSYRFTLAYWHIGIWNCTFHICLQSLYNRVGSCPILISATSAHATDAVATARQVLHFDTRFETLDPHGNKLRRRKDYKDCRNWDKDYLRNCTPLNCEERYFGKRSFFNRETEQCEPVTDCSAPGEYYDIFSNKRVDPGNFVSEEELDLIKQGKFDFNFLDLRGPPSVNIVNTNNFLFLPFLKYWKSACV